ncbi:hypothetical protein TKK_0019682 [Trichogramma kaykai]
MVLAKLLLRGIICQNGFSMTRRGEEMSLAGIMVVLCKYRANTVGITFVKTLLKHAVDVNAKDDNGDSPPHSAVWSNNLDVVKALLKRGADVQSVNFSKFDYEYETSILWFDEIITFLLILNSSIEKGYKMNESSCLTVSTILIDKVIFREPNIVESDKLLVGSLTQLRSFLA